MLSKLNKFRQFMQPSRFKSMWEPGFTALRYNSSSCEPPQKSSSGTCGPSEKSSSCESSKKSTSVGTCGSSEKSSSCGPCGPSKSSSACGSSPPHPVSSSCGPPKSPCAVKKDVSQLQCSDPCGGPKTIGCGSVWERVCYCEGRNGRRRTSLLSKDTLMLNYEILPILLCLVVAMGWTVFVVSWISTTRDAVRYTKNSHFIYETLDLLNPPKRKLIVVNQQYKPMKELYDIYKAMEEGCPPEPPKPKPGCNFF